MIESYNNNIHKMKVFIDNIDYALTDSEGRPLYKIKDTLTEMQNLSKALAALKELEVQYKEELDEATGLRGDTTPGLFD